MSGLVPILTQAGLAAANNAATNGLQVKITEVGLGNFSYAVEVDDAGRATATALRNERQRVELQSASNLDDFTVELGFIAEGTPDFWVREFGFYLEDGTLFAIWSQTGQSLAWKSQDNPLIIGFELSLTALPAGTVTFETTGPPLELLFTHPLAVITESLARTHIETFQLRERVRILEETSSQ